MKKNVIFMWLTLPFFGLFVAYYLNSFDQTNTQSSFQDAKEQRGSEVSALKNNTNRGKISTVTEKSDGKAVVESSRQVIQRLEHLLQNASAEETASEIRLALSHPVTEVRMSATDTAMALEPETGVPILGNALKNDHSVVRELALDYLKTLDFEHQVAAIEIALKDAEAPAVHDIMASLNESPDSLLFAVLLESAQAGKYSSANTRLVAAMLAGWLGDNSLSKEEMPTLENIAQYWSQHRSEYSDGMLRFQ